MNFVRPIIQEVVAHFGPDALGEQLGTEAGIVVLRSALLDSPQARYSFVTARPFLAFRSFGSRCELTADGQVHEQFGDPWHLLDDLMARYELLEELDLPFPLGGCFGYWGYDRAEKKWVGTWMDTMGTGTVSDEKIARAVRKVFGFKPAEIVAQLNLLRPIYRQTTNYGHFGKAGLPWELTNRVAALRAAAS